MTISITDAKRLEYENFFAGLRLLHSDPLVLRKINELEQETKRIQETPSSKEDIWRAKLRYMANLRAGWNAESLLVSGASIRTAENLLPELDKFMDTTQIEMKASPSGVLSLYWFDEFSQHQVEILSEDEFNVERSSFVSSKSRMHSRVNKNTALKKILDWAIPSN